MAYKAAKSHVFPDYKTFAAGCWFGICSIRDAKDMIDSTAQAF